MRRPHGAACLLLVGFLLCCSPDVARAGFLDGISNALSSAVGTVTGGVTSAAGTVANATEGAVDTVTSGVDTAADSVSSALNTATGAVQQGLDTASGAVGDGVHKLSGYVSNVANLTEVAGSDLAADINSTVFNGQRHPIVFWPAFGTSVISVEVANSSRPSCPSKGSFDVGFGQSSLLHGFPEDCIYPLLQTSYDAATGSFSNPPGVSTSISDFGGQFCAPIPYEPLFVAAQAVGYTIGKDFQVACYDWRMTPFTDVGTDGPHLQRAKELVETAFNASGGLPVYLAGHSNGPLYALALLNSTTPQWRQQHIAGLISYAGNWVGQGSSLGAIFTGRSLFDYGAFPSSAAAWASWPATYMAASSYKYYGRGETILRTLQPTGTAAARNYTPADEGQLFIDAGLPAAGQLASAIIGNFTGNNTLPGTNFYGFIGTGSDTVVGITLQNLTQGQASVAGGDVVLQGDGDQEDTDNLVPLNWRDSMGCFHFELNSEKGVSHLGLPYSPSVLRRTFEILFAGTPQCTVPGAASPSPAPGSLVGASGPLPSPTVKAQAG